MGEAERTADVASVVSPAQAQSFDITHASSGLLTASIGPVCLAVWRSKPTRALFEVQRNQLAADVARHPGRQLFLCVVEGKVDPPDQDVRDASAKMINSHGRNLAGCACVIEGSGFRSALTRTVLTGIALVVKTPAPFRFFESTKTACDWLEVRSGVGRLDGLATQVELARAQAAQVL